jgi:hypothetical protein
MRSGLWLIIFCAFGFAAKDGIAQDVQYGQGLLLDYYIIESEDQALEPVGRSMATLLDTSVPEMTYLSPFDIEPALTQFNDQFWGLHWSGFLRVEDAGQYSFNLLFNIAGEGGKSRGAACTSWLSVQDKKLVEHSLEWFTPGNSNSYGDIQLRPGIYTLEAWLACVDSGSVIDGDGETAAMQIAKPSLTINMRGPNDPMLKPVPKNQLLHEL